MYQMKKPLPATWIDVVIKGEEGEKEQLIGQIRARSMSGSDFNYITAMDLENRRYLRECNLDPEKNPVTYDKDGEPVLTSFQNIDVILRTIARFNWVDSRGTDPKKPFATIWEEDGEDNFIEREMENTYEDKLHLLRGDDAFRDAVLEALRNFSEVREKEEEQTEEDSKK